MAAIDVGGTTCRAAVVSADGRILAMARAATPPGGDRVILLLKLHELLDEVSKSHPPTHDRIGLALPGVWDDAGVMQRANNLPRLVGADLPRLFEGALGRPVLLETDVNAAGWAQWRRLESRPRRFAYLSIGTGVGGCIIADGAMLRDKGGRPWQFCDIPVTAAPEGGAGIPPANPPECQLQLEQAVRTALDSGNLTAAAHALAQAVIALCERFQPDVIALGGGAVDHAPQLADLVQDCARLCLAAYSCPDRDGPDARPPDFIRAPLRSDEAGVLGVGSLVLAPG